MEKHIDPLEYQIQINIIKELKIRDWLVMPTHGSAYQSGFPDLYIAHATFGAKWVEVKRPTGYRFTPAQLSTFPALNSKGIPIWILTGHSNDQLALLHKGENWYTFLPVFRKG